MKRLLLLVVTLLLVPTLVKADESVFEDMTDEEKIEELIRITTDLEQRIEELENSEEVDVDVVDEAGGDIGNKGSFKNPFNIDDTGEFVIDSQGSTASTTINNVITGDEAIDHIENRYSNVFDRYDAPEGYVPVVIDVTFTVTSLNGRETHRVSKTDFTSALENGSEIQTRPVNDIIASSYPLMEGAAQNLKVSLFVPEEEPYHLKVNALNGSYHMFFKMDQLD